jgi:hypothetical protein
MPHTLRHAFAPLCALAIGFAAPALVPGSLAAQACAPPADTLERQAASLMQGASTEPFFPPLLLAQVVHDLARIRAEYPAVRSLGPGDDRTRLSLLLTEAAGERLFRLARRAGWLASDTADVVLPQTGLAQLDSLNRHFGATCIEAINIEQTLMFLTITFARPINVEIVAQSYRRIPGVEQAGQVSYVGDGDYVVLHRTPTAREYVFTHGGGDCPAGCIWRDYHAFRVGASGDVEPLGSHLHSQPMSAAERQQWDQRLGERP